MDSKNQQMFNEIKQKINWELNTNNEMTRVIYDDGKVCSCSGLTSELLDGLANIIMNMVKQGIPKREIKRAVRIGLNYERYLEVDNG